MREEINAAILAHGKWKARLFEAIESGKSDFTPEKVKPDNLCDFGKWFYTLKGGDATSSHYKEVMELHARFHQIASTVLELALAGKKDEARKAIDISSEYSDISSRLTLTLGMWRNELSE